MLELEVALIVFGIALAGLGPHLVMTTKQLKRLESRFGPQTTYYLVPSVDTWSRKLGAAASLTTLDPGPLSAGEGATPTNQVQIVSVDRSLGTEDVTAHVTVQAAP